MEPLISINPRTRDLPDDKPGVYIKTFGCQMNEYDSRKLARILEKDYRVVARPEEAELILINTCSVREKPEHKLFSLLGEVKELKTQNANVMIGVGGCVAQQEGENIIKRSRSVDFVFGTHNLSLVPSLIARRKSGGDPQVAVNYRDEWEDLPLGFSEHQLETEKVSALISISRGCNKNCTYCIVPTTRGKEVSRALDEILREVRISVRRGAKEIVLLGQTVNSYGRDLDPPMSFVQLLEQVADVDGVQRIRFISPHPQEIRSDFVKLVTRNPKVCPHIHMPLQSGSDRILKLMNRNYRRKRYISVIEELRQGIPDMSITTDIIVGFPGETEQDFEETLEIMQLVRFQNSYSYMFSPRPGTLAASMTEGIVPEIEKLRRLQKIQSDQEIITQEILQSWVGREVEVLVDGPSRTNPSSLQGRSPQNVMISFPNENLDLKSGMSVMVKIARSHRQSLSGEMVHHEPSMAPLAS